MWVIFLDVLFLYGAFLPKSSAGPAQDLPENLRILFGPPGIFGEIRRKKNLFLVEQVAVQVEHQGFKALGAAINCQKKVLIIHKLNHAMLRST